MLAMGQDGHRATNSPVAGHTGVSRTQPESETRAAQRLPSAP